MHNCGMTLKMKALGCLGLIMAAAISIAGCAHTSHEDSSTITEQASSENSDASNTAVENTDATRVGSLVAGFVIEENDSNDESKRATYPYVVKTQSSVWYLAADDIKLLGEEAFFAGLEEILGMVDLDFADAREALKDYMSEVVAPVVIYTDFCEKAEISAYAGAYCHPVSHFIKIFGDWKQAEYALLHEYVHYLTFVYTDVKPDSNFTSEGIAEYISMLVCENRMCKKANCLVPDEYLEKIKETELWNAAENTIDIKTFYYSSALGFANGAFVGQEYTNVKTTNVIRTDEMQQCMQANDCSYIEAGCITEYLAETYGMDTVMANLGKNLMTMSSSVYGKVFSEIYKDFTILINAKYEAYVDSKSAK